MLKPIYKNYKSGKLYCFEKNAEDETKTDIFTAYVDEEEYNKAETKIDKHGKPYKVFDVEPATTKAGHKVYRKVKA